MASLLHPDVAALAPLLGTWVGDGQGDYPTIDAFAYHETVTFGHAGKPFLAYGQRTSAADDGRPLHAEQGYLRMPAPGAAEFVFVHPTGITEVDEGSAEFADGGAITLTLTSATIGRTTTAKRVDAVERTFSLAGDVLTYTVRMAAVGQPLTHHLAATLHRQA